MGKRVDDLSGGERNRLQLAKLIATRPNFLILDEPTNHLDISSREVVEEAFQEFEGTLLVVSHDRYFLEKVATRVVEIRDRRLVSFPGTFGEFWQLRGATRTQSAGRATKRRQEREASAPLPKREAKPGRNLANVEARIEAAEAEKVDLEKRVAGAFGRNDVKLGQQLQGKLRRVETALEELYRKWEAEVG
jgi:ATP-binding cassette subfamily F protein 3